MHSHLAHACLTGLASAGIFLLAARLGLGFFFLFLPSLPLLYAGFSGKPQAALLGGAGAALLIALPAGLETALIYLLFIGLPSWYAAKAALRSFAAGGKQYWFPMGHILLQFSLYACAAIALIVLYYSGHEGGIARIMGDHIRREFAQAGEEYGHEYGAAMQVLATHWTFLVFAMTSWFWGLVLYLHIWAAQKILTQQNKQLRPDVAIEPFVLPSWLISLLVIFALGSMIGSPSMQLLCRASLMTLMLPYFLLGCALMHEASRKWPSRGFFLFFVYFMVFVQFWPALVLAAIGFFDHIKHLSSRQTSSKS